MSPRAFKISVEGAGEADCYEGERALVAMERAQGRGQLKDLSRKLPVGCRRGGCGVCRARVLAGEYRREAMSRAHVSETDEAAGVVLSCAVFPLSDLVLRLESDALTKPFRRAEEKGETKCL
ncbi:2Fe-2S iron-sulfur cluster-binding protein [Acidocella sp.]|uniref:2Fe-2S iron-sulfur cluster-binding protein n=1 Tax=Acidocella sp. TaxID=50710 RepID=UPI003D02BE17